MFSLRKNIAIVLMLRCQINQAQFATPAYFANLPAVFLIGFIHCTTPFQF